ncbi:MAG: hypothetical protein JRG86_02935 [Deltaproteobacteria bacterium]|nr:hypothetical protein [Deltaproteobacteria bacterium]MBW2497746.1 hypothetical protein [Deltaproteobacteria bacterium]
MTRLIAPMLMSLMVCAVATSSASAQQCTAIETILSPDYIIAGLGTCLGLDPERDVLSFQPVPLPECEACIVEVTATWDTGSESLLRGSPWPKRA